MSDSENNALDEVSLTEIARQLTLTAKKRLKSALWFSIGKIVDEETLKLGINATPQFIGALTEMVWAQIGTLWHLGHILHALQVSILKLQWTETTSTDLESFAK